MIASLGRTVSPNGDAHTLRTFLAGWDAAEDCLLDTLDSVPDEHVGQVIDSMRQRRGRRRMSHRVSHLQPHPPTEGDNG